MKKLLFPVLLVALLSGCRKEEGHLSENTSTPLNQSQVTTTEKKDINPASVHPEALDYYKNIAQIADWYAEHPRHKNTGHATNGDTTNTLLAKFRELSILDSNNVERSIMSMDKETRKEFLDTWSLIEAHQMTEKIKSDTSNQAIGLISERNEAFKQAFGGSNKTLDTETEDPYWKICKTMESRVHVASSLRTHTVEPGLSLSIDDAFWKKVIMSGLMSVVNELHLAPNSLPPQIFADRIRATAAKGRLLIALPGGWNTVDPIIFYPNKEWYDVGHVAILSQNSFPQILTDKTVISIGANSKQGNDYEEIKEAWCTKHGIAFIGQIYDVKWITKYTYKKVWWMTIKTPYWVREARDVDNNAIYNQMVGIVGKKYCYPHEILVAKFAAPGRFICSTTAWWCAKQSAGVNIGDFYKSTIFPAGVYLSDRVRIIGNTIK
jgi:hypothetical protein